MSAERAGVLIGEAEEASRERDDETACQRYEAAMPLLDDRGPIVRGLAGFGWALHRLGQHEAALARHEEALRALERVFPSDAPKRAVVQDGIAHALLALGRTEAALALFRQILDSGIGGRARAVALYRAADAAVDAGQPDEARAYQAESVEILRALLEQHPAVDEELETAVQNVVRVLLDGGRERQAGDLLRLLYARQSFRTARRRRDAEGTLLLLSSWDGNVPDLHLLARVRMNVVKWLPEFGDPSDEQRLPDHAIALNLVGDADQGAAALARVADFESRTRVPVLNRAAHVLRTRRDRVAALFGGIDGLLVPRCVRVAGAARATRAADLLAEHGLRAPILLREPGRHGGQSVERADTDEAFARLWGEGGDAYLTHYVDYASPDGAYRKYRVIFVDRQPYPYHLAISPRWLVHYFSADMIEHDAKREEELRFLADMPGVLGPSAMAALREIGARMDLDYAGVDFSLLADGRVLLFESNATMLVHPEDRNGVLAAKNPFVDRILEAFGSLIRSRLPAG